MHTTVSVLGAYLIKYAWSILGEDSLKYTWRRLLDAYLAKTPWSILGEDSLKCTWRIIPEVYFSKYILITYFSKYGPSIFSGSAQVYLKYTWSILGPSRRTYWKVSMGGGTFQYDSSMHILTQVRVLGILVAYFKYTSSMPCAVRASLRRQQQKISHFSRASLKICRIWPWERWMLD